jgi:hypothetical protein
VGCRHQARAPYAAVLIVGPLVADIPFAARPKRARAASAGAVVLHGLALPPPTALTLTAAGLALLVMPHRGGTDLTETETAGQACREEAATVRRECAELIPRDRASKRIWSIGVLLG